MAKRYQKLQSVPTPTGYGGFLYSVFPVSLLASKGVALSERERTGEATFGAAPTQSARPTTRRRRKGSRLRLLLGKQTIYEY